jgi:hypothetical protein
MERFQQKLLLLGFEKGANRMSDEKNSPGELVGDMPIPHELLSEMTEEQRNEILSGKALGDDIKVFVSSIDTTMSAVAIRAGEEVCQYCFRRFRESEPEGRSTEIYLKHPVTGDFSGTRMKVHAICHDRANPL